MRLVVLQIVQYPRYSKLAADFRRREVVFTAHRGAIFDRSGKSLAVSVDLRTVWADPELVENPERAARRIAPLLHKPVAEVEAALQSVPGIRFKYIARQIDPKLGRRIEALDLPGIHVETESSRMYPADRVAAHVLGFVNVEGEALGGVEYGYDGILKGRPGRMSLEQDPTGRVPLPQADYVYDPAKPGRSLFLTIDKDLQYYTQLALAGAAHRYHASSGSAIVMRPHTGEILAMANTPDFNPNSFNDFTDDDRRNRAVTDNFEPGSSFKIVTAAAALQEGLVTPRSVLNVPDQVQVSDRVIHDSHYHPPQDMTVKQIIEQSSNVGTVKLGLQLGPDRMDEWVRKFGFGEPTGLDFPGEASGIVLDRDEWSGSTIGTVPVGQGIAVSELQLAAAYGVIANRGMWVEPKLLRATMHPDGAIEAAAPPARRRVLSKKVAAQMLDILTGVVKEGTGVEAQIPGYAVAGKTGTAQKPLPTGGYGNSYIASFCGVAPARRPQLLVIVTFDDPDPIWGGATAAPAFKQIMEYSLRHLGVPPDSNAAKSAGATTGPHEGPVVRD